MFRLTLLVLASQALAGVAYGDTAAAVSYPEYVDVESTIQSLTIESGGAMLVSLTSGFSSAVQEYGELPCANSTALAVIADSKMTQKAALIAANIAGQIVTIRVTGCDKKRREFFSVSDVRVRN